MPQDANPSQQNARPRSRLAIDFDKDRSSAFRRANWHSVIVRVLRKLLPVTVVGLMSTYAIFMQRSISISVGENKQVAADSVSISTQALIAKNPKYEGFDKKGGKFLVRSKTAKQALGQKGPVLLDTIDGTLTDANNVVTKLTARAGTFDTTSNVLQLFERIDVTSQNGMHATLTRATVETKAGVITSDQPVVVNMPSGTVHGRALRIEQKQRLIIFSGGVVANLKQEAKPPSAASRTASSGGRAATASSQPVDITSATLRIDDTTKRATFSGKVVAAQADSTLETEELVVIYEGNAGAAASANAASAPQAGQASGEAAPQSSRIKRMLAPKPVVLTRESERASGSSGAFDAATDQATLYGPVEITAGTDRKANADQADIDNKNDTILLTGNVVVVQQENVLKGGHLFVDRKAGKMALTSPATPGKPIGRITAHLQQAASADGKANAKAPRPAAGDSPLGLRSDPDQPIDIVSQSLDVDDHKKTAIFRGKVEAVQGDYRLLTEELVATYSGGSGMMLGSQAGQAGARPDKAAGAQLQKVIAPRRVRVVAKDGRSAVGNTAEFDLKRNAVLLTGDVVLTQGKSVTSGPRALLDLTRGSMQLLDVPVAAARPGTTQKKQRVRALFYPQQLQDATKGAKQAKPPARGANKANPSDRTDAGGWSSVTSPTTTNGR